jgi:hypothetical protein
MQEEAEEAPAQQVGPERKLIAHIQAVQAVQAAHHL